MLLYDIASVCLQLQRKVNCVVPVLKDHAINTSMSGDVEVKFHTHCNSDRRVLSISEVLSFSSHSYYEHETRVDLFSDTKQPVRVIKIDAVD